MPASLARGGRIGRSLTRWRRVRRRRFLLPLVWLVLVRLILVRLILVLRLLIPGLGVLRHRRLLVPGLLVLRRLLVLDYLELRHLRWL